MFGGDLLLFATVEPGKRRKSRLETLWQPYIAGHITVHEIDCSHEELIRADRLQSIGRLIENYLGNRDL